LRRPLPRIMTCHPVRRNLTLKVMQKRQTNQLRKGRVSLSDARYFITMCAVRPESRLTEPVVSHAIRLALEQSVANKDFVLLCASLMPDHVHLLIRLSQRLSVGQVVGKLKFLTRKSMTDTGCRWQANFFEHRLRPDEMASPYALYIFLNPYRKGIIQRDACWPFWIQGPADFDFTVHLHDGKYPPVQWITSDLDALGITANHLGQD